MFAPSMRDYKAIAYAVPDLASRPSIIDHLCNVLPDVWYQEYVAASAAHGDIVTISFGDDTRRGPFAQYMFDHASANSSLSTGEDRVVAVWGTSGAAPASTRDKSRLAGFLKGVWSRRFPAYDRGHFFAHTIGGGLDLNLFPQRLAVNRRGAWRKMERYCARHPGTFCFVRPTYLGTTWKPTRLEYGIFKLPPDNELDFWGAEFDN